MFKAIGSNKYLTLNYKADEFYNYIKDLIENEMVLRMQNFNHHFNTSCFQHSLNVAYYNYLICKRLGLNAKASARAGLLHDFYLYDKKGIVAPKPCKFHWVKHPKIALQNAIDNFNISKLEGDMIKKHMWPLTLSLPRYRESFVITLVDKYCCLLETVSELSTCFKRGLVRFTRNAYFVMVNMVKPL